MIISDIYPSSDFFHLTWYCLVFSKAQWITWFNHSLQQHSIPFCRYTTPLLSTHLSFHSVLNAVINNDMHLLSWKNVFVTWSLTPRSGILISMRVLFLLSQEKYEFYKGLSQTTFPLAVGKSSFPPHLCQHRLFQLLCFLNMGHFHWWEIISYFCLDLNFP